MSARRIGGLVSQHGRAILEIGLVSVLGILATAGFQIVSLRGLGAEQYGLLASFLALINVAAIGSSALRNSVAVTTADVTRPPQARNPRRGRLDSSMIEALVLGGACTCAIVFLSPWLASSLAANAPAVIFTAAAMVPYFLFSRAQGLLQGSGDSRSVVWWSTGAQLVQIALAVAALLLGFGPLGILAALVLTAAFGAFGASIQARGFGVPGVRRPFSFNSSVVLLITIAFAWLTNIDVVLVRAGAPEDVAGAYAAAAVLVKTTLIIPATLALYLLPRFVSRRKDAAMTRLGVNVTLGITLMAGLAMFFVVLLGGPLIVQLLFGPGYQASGRILPWFALAWLPWALVQGVLTRLTAASSKVALAVLVLAIVGQWITATILLPNVFAMILANGCLGLVVFVCLFVIHLRPGLSGKGALPASHVIHA
ncbi:lipopolysaccharide biosynthesis protein [Glaciibacter sp. 2TAF33]|uniref:lipopolysaccharide biosynthesis protein n=1 Tax=Glaciibacter sp. 2TAF33 TaxID=3233015 RepID=UPI003F8FE00E